MSHRSRSHNVTRVVSLYSTFVRTLTSTISTPHTPLLPHWSGRRESNPRSQLGKLARITTTICVPVFGRKSTRGRTHRYSRRGTKLGMCPDDRYWAV
jgi:hypothetical protein